MTCIATDGKTIAADSRSCIGDLIVTDAAVKLARGKDGSVLGIAGDAGTSALVREWFEKGADVRTIPKILPTDKDGNPAFEGLALRPDGRVDFLDNSFTFVEFAIPAAVGSGTEIALGAMLAGKSPVDAIALAATRVATVGGEVVEAKAGKGRK